MTMKINWTCHTVYVMITYGNDMEADNILQHAIDYCMTGRYRESLPTMWIAKIPYALKHATCLTSSGFQL